MREKWIKAGLALLMVLGLTGCTKTSDVPENQDGAKAHGALRVEGTRLMDEHGDAVQLRGMSSHGILWYPEYLCRESMESLRAQGANVFRLAAYSDDPGGGYLSEPEKTLELVRQGIRAARESDLYVIVDWHTLSDADPNRHVDEAKTFFDTVAGEQAGKKDVIYEICNEPNSGTSWEQIREYAGQVIPVIRKYSPEALILVGTPEYSFDITKVCGEKLEDEQVMYTFHYYAGQSNEQYEQMMETCHNSGVPVFVSEWGIQTDSGYGDSGENLQKGEKFASYLNRHGISWTAWSLSNKEEPFSLLKPDCGKLSDWGQDDLTEVGKILWKSLKIS